MCLFVFNGMKYNLTEIISASCLIKKDCFKKLCVCVCVLGQNVNKMYFILWVIKKTLKLR